LKELAKVGDPSNIKKIVESYFPWNIKKWWVSLSYI
jgi:hypothetical protein